MEQNANALNLRARQMGIDWRGKMRDMREKRVLEKEIASMECEASEISRKRLRDEVADLKAEVKFEQETSSRLDDENTGLLIQLDDLREKLVEAHADVEDLLEFKSIANVPGIFAPPHVPQSLRGRVELSLVFAGLDVCHRT